MLRKEKVQSLLDFLTGMHFKRLESKSTYNSLVNQENLEVVRSLEIVGANKALPGLQVAILDGPDDVRVQILLQDGTVAWCNYSITMADPDVLGRVLKEIEVEMARMLSMVNQGKKN